jgi:acyl carrier protein
MTHQQFLYLLDELFELDQGTIRLEDSFRDIPGWSSLTFVGLIALADEHYAVTLAPTAELSCATVQDLVNLLDTRLSPGEMAA